MLVVDVSKSTKYRIVVLKIKSNGNYSIQYLHFLDKLNLIHRKVYKFANLKFSVKSPLYVPYVFDEKIIYV